VEIIVHLLTTVVSCVLRIFRFYLLEEERKTVQLKVKDVMMNTAKEEIANEEVAINKTATNSNTEIIFLRDKSSSLNDSTDSINRE
jgi:hypothetical protein